MKHNEKLSLLLLLMSILNISLVISMPLSDKNELIDIVKIVSPQENKIRFQDVIGHQEFKNIAQSVVPAFKDKALYALKTKDIPKGIFLPGSTGNGKKMLAKAFAGETDSSIIQLTGESFMKMNPSQIHQLFAQARSMAPCIVIIDGIYDFIATKQDQDLSTHTPEMQAYYDEMDSLDASGLPVMIFGTLNYQEGMKFNIGGLFDVSHHVVQPSFQEKIEFLNTQLKDFKKTDDFNTYITARLLIGCSFSQLVQITEKMEELIVQSSSDLVSMDIFDRAHDFMSNGAEEGFDLQTPERKYQSAIHEAGHAMIVVQEDSQCRLHSISLRQNSRSFGRIADIALSEPYIPTEDELLYDIVVGFGGGVAEQVFGLPEPRSINNENGLKDFISRSSVGSDWANLVEKADEIVRSRCLAAGDSYEECSAVNGEEIVKIIQSCYEKATAIITAHKDHVKKLAERVLEKETIYADEAYAICGKKKPLCDFEKE